MKNTFYLEELCNYYLIKVLRLRLFTLTFSVSKRKKNYKYIKHGVLEFTNKQVFPTLNLAKLRAVFLRFFK